VTVVDVRSDYVIDGTSDCVIDVRSDYVIDGTIDFVSNFSLQYISDRLIYKRNYLISLRDL
jgi:hypothetical protein